METIARFTLLAGLILSFSGCMTVQPWEREYQSDPIMNGIGEEGESAFETHLFRARSGGVLGSNGEGAGCGCEQ
jgi:hypothetical protein